MGRVGSLGHRVMTSRLHGCQTGWTFCHPSRRPLWRPPWHVICREIYWSKWRL